MLDINVNIRKSGRRIQENIFHGADCLRLHDFTVEPVFDFPETLHGGIAECRIFYVR